MKFLGLEGIEDTLGGDLSYGGQRLVDLGIALGSKPQVLLLDEPLAGLAAAERERVSQAGARRSPATSRCCSSSTTSTACSRSRTASR